MLTDIAKGFITSIRLDLALFHTPTIGRFMNLLKVNFLMHVLPSLIMYAVGLDLIWIVGLLIRLISPFVNMIAYTDISIILCSSSDKPVSISFAKSLTMSVSMFMYQSSVYLTIMLINGILYSSSAYLRFIINISILTIYHSLYTYNNYWTYRGLNTQAVIHTHGKYWPYFFGYGLVATILYMSTSTSASYLVGIYNCLLGLMLMIPFLTKFDRYKPTYPKINLILFTYPEKFIFFITKKILVLVYGPKPQITDQSKSTAK